MTVKKFLLGLIVIAAGAYFSSCEKTSGQKLREQEAEDFAAYLEEFNVTAEPTESGLYYIELTPGHGDTIQTGDVVQMFYTGWLITGELFDASGPYEPFRFTVGAGGVIEAWEEAVLKMQTGTKAKIITPSRLAYGSSGRTGYPGIPRYAALVFEMEVYKVYRNGELLTD